MTSTLRTLLDRVEKGEGADRELDAAIGDHFGEAHKQRNRYRRGHYIGGQPVLVRVDRVFPAYTSSIDAAVALVEKVLPDWGRLLYWNNCQGHTARLEDNANEYTGSTGAEFEARGATAPLALLAALLRAKIAQEEGA